MYLRIGARVGFGFVIMLVVLYRIFLVKNDVLLLCCVVLCCVVLCCVVLCCVVLCCVVLCCVVLCCVVLCCVVYLCVVYLCVVYLCVFVCSRLNGMGRESKGDPDAHNPSCSRAQHEQV